MKCKKCGEPLTAYEIVCKNCGTMVAVEDIEAESKGVDELKASVDKSKTTTDTIVREDSSSKPTTELVEPQKTKQEEIMEVLTGDEPVSKEAPKKVGTYKEDKKTNKKNKKKQVVEKARRTLMVVGGIVGLVLIIVLIVNIVGLIKGPSYNVDKIHTVFIEGDDLMVMSPTMDEPEKIGSNMSVMDANVIYEDEDTFYFIDSATLMLYDKGEMTELAQEVRYAAKVDDSEQLLLWQKDSLLVLYDDGVITELSDEVYEYDFAVYKKKITFVTQNKDNESMVTLYDGKTVESILDLKDDQIAEVLSADRKGAIVWIRDPGQDEIVKVSYKGKEETLVDDIETVRGIKETGFNYFTTDQEYSYFSYDLEESIKLGDDNEFIGDYANIMDDTYRAALLGDTAVYYYDERYDKPEKLLKHEGLIYIDYNYGYEWVSILDESAGEGYIFDVSGKEIVEYEIDNDELIKVITKPFAESTIVLLVDEELDGYIYDFEKESSQKFGKEVEEAVYLGGDVLYLNDDEELVYFDGEDQDELMDDVASFSMLYNDDYFMVIDEDSALHVGKVGKKADEVLEDYVSMVNYGGRYLYLIDDNSEVFLYDIKKDKLTELDMDLSQYINVNIPYELIDESQWGQITE